MPNINPIKSKMVRSITNNWFERVLKKLIKGHLVSFKHTYYIKNENDCKCFPKVKFN